MKTFLIFSLLLISISSVNIAQQVNTYGILPSINLNTKLPKNWSVNIKMESRQQMYNDGFKYAYKGTDPSFIVGKKVGIRTIIATGYLLCIKEDGVNNRFIQKIGHVKQYRNFKLSHRFLTDQTFIQDNSTEYRVRYRLTAEVPLSGQTLDLKEFFIKINNEYLNFWQGEKYDLEIRNGGFIGYVITAQNKLEFGLDYRKDSFIHNKIRNRFWIGLNLYQSLNKNI